MINILIVDDQEESRYLLEALLKGNGYAVEPFANGAEALERLRLGGIDLIVSDILMPVMDGFALCHKVKTDEALRQIPLVFYTATYTGPQDEAFALKIGADRFLVKPCEPDVLMEAVRSVLEGSGDRAACPAQELLEDKDVFKLYNERLVRKLEEKMLQLEKESTSLREADQSLRSSEKKYRRLHESMTDGFVYVDMQGFVRESNEAYRKMLGYAEEELSRLTYQALTPEKWHALEEDIVQGQVLQKGCSDVYEKEYRKKDGTVFPVELRTFLICDDSGEKEGMWAIVRDISERKRAEKMQKELEEQLHQAQKMESVGRLAGGVAHDFNNMLAVIFIAIELIRMKLSDADPLRENLLEIERATTRARDITRQLLAFSRKQIIEPKIVALNELIAESVKGIIRLIGEDVEVHFIPGQGVQPVLIDPSQVDQVLINLALNARDAMPDGGTFTIETANVAYDEAYCREHIDFKPGRYVSVSVSDEGHGMDRETLENIFEPFFTTKEAWKGTGLGLAMVYGVMKQNGGFVNVYSEVGSGTTFKLYFPCAEGDEQGVGGCGQAETAEPMRGSGAILLVEDDAMLCRIIRTSLETIGYSVTAAATPAEAISAAERGGAAHVLLLTDIVMPGMNGMQLSEKLRAVQPAMKVLFMSGYAENVIVHRGEVEAGRHFIQKPFLIQDLTRKIREILNQ
ncbi:MAG: multi-sensor hybrid histidine kinase [Nitrospirae bacterium]|nr:MAG: multi-sensor hybrid histidine kinase [Nitrospirota bacterium]